MTVQDGWDPAQYNRFAAQREQPFWDLVQLLAPVTAPEVVDLGCGDGRLTGRLHEALGAAGTLGVDSSPAMIADAQAHAGGALRFRLGTSVRSASTGARMPTALRVGTTSSLPTPPCSGFPTTVRCSAVGPAFCARAVSWRCRSEQRRPSRPPAGGGVGRRAPERATPDPVAEHVLPPEEYALVLESLGFEAQHVRLQVYLHHLASTAEVVEWVKGTSLTRFKESFGDEGWPAFVDLYRARLLATLGSTHPTSTPSSASSCGVT